ncbi:MAG: hypothetical protein ABR525_02925 [Candidatus Limnocylindria bacterium]
MMDPALVLRPGAKVRYLPVHTDVWGEGELVRQSPNGEDWLVKNKFGRFWIHYSRLRPATGPLPVH